MNKKSITYVESWVNFIKLDVQCDHHLFLPLFLIASTINRLSYYFLSVYPMHLISLVKGLWCLHIALHSCGPFFPSCHKLHYHLDWGHKNPEANFSFKHTPRHFNWDNWYRIWCAATNPVLLNSELSFTR